MCGSQYDYCTPAFTSRADDYRGCDAYYRSGSIFRSGEFDCDEDGNVEFIGDRSMNAGNFGMTTPVETKRPTPQTLEPKKLGKPSVGIPSTSPAPSPNSNYSNGIPPENNVLPFENQIPSSPPPPPAPSTGPRGFESPSLDQTRGNGPNITIEELRRLDPSVTDVRILNIEDNLNPKTGAQVQ